MLPDSSIIRRDFYLKRISPFYNNEMIKVITGVRGCGKSVLLRQIQQELIETGTPQSHILYISFEDYAYRNLLEGEELYSYVLDHIDTSHTWYLLFDEIQHVKDFERVINSLRTTHQVSMFITGSNSRLLSGEFATHLAGRTVSFLMLPFTFREFCMFTKKHTDRSSLEQYMQWGGFPLAVQVHTEEMKEAILSNLYDSIVLKDIIGRNPISSPHTLERILEYLVASSSLTLSGNSIARSMNDIHMKITAPTVYDYIRFCTDSYVVSRVQRYDIRGKKVLSFEEKAYVVDLGLFHLKTNRAKDEFSLITKTLIFNELLARGYQVFIGKTRKGEIDFIAKRNGKTCYIQACYLLASEETIEREFGAFDSITDNYPKYVISHDEIAIGEREGIIHLPLLTFLSNESAIPG